MIIAPTGGVGGAKLVHGLASALAPADLVAVVTALGNTPLVTATVMTTDAHRAQLAREVFALADTLGRPRRPS